MANLGSGIKLGQRIRNIGRLAQITNVFAKHGLYSLAEGLGAGSWLTPQQVKTAKEISKQQGDDPDAPTSIGEIHGLPARLRRSFEELGPAFVKLGQLLSVREDLLPKPIIEELCELHNNVAQLPFSEVEAVLKQELSEEKLAAFAVINPQPLAAGSIAQVHEATLKSGEEVVIKIQRPGISQTIMVDLTLMEELAGMLEKFLPEARFARPHSLVAEFKRATIGELDFIREGGNIAKMTRNFADVDYVDLPEVYWKLTSSVS
jgi:ubiquinone biosynthesis protein